LLATTTGFKQIQKEGSDGGSADAAPLINCNGKRAAAEPEEAQSGYTIDQYRDSATMDQSCDVVCKTPTRAREDLVYLRPGQNPSAGALKSLHVNDHEEAILAHQVDVPVPLCFVAAFIFLTQCHLAPNIPIPHKPALSSALLASNIFSPHTPAPPLHAFPLFTQFTSALFQVHFQDSPLGQEHLCSESRQAFRLGGY
jgi:hypothetical protein